MLNFAVVPLVGTWIEIQVEIENIKEFLVVPLVGTWIEILLSGHRWTGTMSFPSWERGLKYMQDLLR